RDGIEVVVGEDDETESLTAKLDDLADDEMHVPLAWLLTVCAPHGAERAVLRAAADRLHRRPHVSIFRQQIPSGRVEGVAGHAPSVVGRLGRSLVTIVEHG